MGNRIKTRNSPDMLLGMILQFEFLSKSALTRLLNARRNLDCVERISSSNQSSLLPCHLVREVSVLGGGVGGMVRKGCLDGVGRAKGRDVAVGVGDLLSSAEIGGRVGVGLVVCGLGWTSSLSGFDFEWCGGVYCGRAEMWGGEGGGGEVAGGDADCGNPFPRHPMRDEIVESYRPPLGDLHHYSSCNLPQRVTGAVLYIFFSIDTLCFKNSPKRVEAEPITPPPSSVTAL
ncbi:hypothetical protein Tco_0771133 [Tanacetum coccineum]|uniref:Uncharacterized protein n=1 Tax=Tanacetum coccineum TaxID=301880 RepID=A0ABQ4ZHQ4_9ASTR